MGTLNGKKNRVKYSDFLLHVSSQGPQLRLGKRHGETSQGIPWETWSSWCRLHVPTVCPQLTDPQVTISQFWISWGKSSLHCMTGIQYHFTLSVSVHKPRWNYFSGFHFPTNLLEIESTLLWKPFLNSLFIKVFPSCFIAPPSACPSCEFHMNWTNFRVFPILPTSISHETFSKFWLSFSPP